MARQQYQSNTSKHVASGFVQETLQDSVKTLALWTPGDFGEVIDLAGGYQHRINWAPVSGADKVELSSAVLRLGAAAIENYESFAVSQHGSYIDIAVGKGKALLSLKLNGLKSDAIPLHNSGELSAADLKLLVCIKNPKGDYTPLYALPNVSAKGVFPASFVGASFSAGSLSFSTPLQAESVRLQLVNKDFPEKNAPKNIVVSGVSGSYMSLPVNISATLDDGSALFGFAGVLPLESADVQVSAMPQLSNLLQRKLDAGEALQASIELHASPSSGSKAMVQVLIPAPAGYLVRNIGGVHTSKLSGEATRVNIALQTPLAFEVPNTALADLSVIYAGVRILSDLSDTLPGAQGSVQGSIIASEPRTKVLPPQALQFQSIARIGVLGRAPEPAELVLELIDYSAGIAGEVVAKADELKLEMQHRLGVQWFEFDQAEPLNAPLGIRLRCNRGRFFWLSNDQHEPMVRLAIYDPDPGDEIISLNGDPFLTGSELPFTAQQQRLPAQLFVTDMPVLDSNLFLTVDVADLQLRYAR